MDEYDVLRGIITNKIGVKLDSSKGKGKTGNSDGKTYEDFVHEAVDAEARGDYSAARKLYAEVGNLLFLQHGNI